LVDQQPGRAKDVMRVYPDIAYVGHDRPLYGGIVSVIGSGT
jgi:hypothetical protein